MRHVIIFEKRFMSLQTKKILVILLNQYLILMGGNNSSIQYSVPVTEKKAGESAIYRNPQFKDNLLDGPQPNIHDMKTAMLKTFTQFSKNNCLGTIIRKQGQQDSIEYLTYKDLLDQAKFLGSGIINEHLAYQPEGEDLRFVGIFSRNRAEWTVVDVACILYRLTTIPLYDTLGDENISYVFSHTNLTTVFVNDVSLRALMKTKDMVKVKTIVCFDKFTEEQHKFFADKGIKLRLYTQIIDSGKTAPKDYNTEQFKVKPKDCLTFCYTSGTTGPPKGAMLCHNNYCSFLGACSTNKDVKFMQSDLVLSYLPLPHVLERQLLYVIMYAGGTIVFYSGDVQKIKDDLALVKPTVFVSVPRLFSRFYDAIKKKLGELEGFTKTALDHGLNKKLNNVTTNGGYTHKIYDPLFFNKTKAALGGRVRLMISGSAPLLPEVHKFLKVTMGAPLLEGYGQTESTGASFITAAEDPLLAHVGGPVSNIQFKLVDIPEMRYTSDDKDEQGNLMPRGQIWLRGPGVFLGYYKDDEKTKDAMTEDGWLKSGDVGAILPANKGLKIIDRKKNIFKLSQGQYIAAERVENAYSDCPLLSQIFLTGDSSESYPVVVVTAHKKALEDKAKQIGVQASSYEQLCRNQKLRTAVLIDMNDLGRKKGLKGFEVAKNIYIEPVGFQSKQILTNTMKVQRHEARRVYKKQVQDLYKEGMLPVDKEKK